MAYRPDQKPRALKADYSLELTDAQIVLLEAELKRPLTQDEKDCITLTLEGLSVPYSPGSFWEPPEGGYVEDVRAYYQGADVSNVFENDEKTYERFEEKLGDEWDNQATADRERYEAHLCDIADAKRKGEY